MIGRIIGSLCLLIGAAACAKMTQGVWEWHYRMEALYPNSIISNAPDWYFLAVFACAAIGMFYWSMKLLFTGELF